MHSNSYEFCKRWQSKAPRFSARFISHRVKCLPCFIRCCFCPKEGLHLWADPKKPLISLQSMPSTVEICHIYQNIQIKIISISNGFQCPLTFNPADFIIGTLASSGRMSDSHRLAHRICDAYAVSQIPEMRRLQSISEESLNNVRNIIARENE